MEYEKINEKLDKYFSMTEKAMKMLEIKNPEDEKAGEFLGMAKNYFSDAKYFREKGDLLTALAAVSYSHAWLDAGARLGLFKVDNSSDLFAVD